ncbi:protein ABIL1-like isoform X2 [Cicer arietinum]|uniref:Protein ABIL1-like isoform X2 n=1 Tax=Cicer arietinum TaxID=3827 RepID=A0A1S2XUM4_CICAR|nr:protein ABIL1-like isoform X2 [Cicer arietinum]
MTFDEFSMERSKSFVFALQELKNLRPQLYSAAEYCEKSYLHSDQKQMLLDNLKDYAARALVNAVDHLGTVAYKLTDLLDQQTLDISTMDLKISTLNQRLLTCQTYTDKEGLRQQKLLSFIPRHHKHYILPNSANKKVHFRPYKQSDGKQNSFKTRTRFRPSGTPVSKTLSWHLASETKSTLKRRSSHASKKKDPKFSAKTTGVFHLIDNEEITWLKPSASKSHAPNGVPTSSAATQTLGVSGRDALDGFRPLKTFGSFDNLNLHETVHVPSRSKSVLSSFFVKQRAAKLRAGSVS